MADKWPQATGGATTTHSAPTVSVPELAAPVPLRINPEIGLALLLFVHSLKPRFIASVFSLNSKGKIF